MSDELRKAYLDGFNAGQAATKARGGTDRAERLGIAGDLFAIADRLRDIDQGKKAFLIESVAYNLAESSRRTTYYVDGQEIGGQNDD